MARGRTVYHVVPDARSEKWMVLQEGIDHTRGVFRRKAEAVLDAKLRARRQEPSQVKVHNSDGNMEYESTYGKDPARGPS
jgi:hypothetical protein